MWVEPILLVLAFALAVVLLLYIFQHSLIYHPRRYSPVELSSAAEEIEYHTGEGKQVAFYVAPRDSTTGLPDRLWLVFGGNATLALDWRDFVFRHPDERSGFLLIDYPGFGKCEGRASPKSILESSGQALESLYAHLQVPIRDSMPAINMLGHSLGAAAALQLAPHHDVSRMVLLAPFTSLRAMARRAVGGPLARLLRHDFENADRLREIASGSSPPDIIIIHGRRDEVIPVEMGRRLAKEFPALIQYREAPGADHNSLLILHEADVYRAMTE
jgi:pimeloyl-ACP methyl ester carboxylesterase